MVNEREETTEFESAEKKAESGRGRTRTCPLTKPKTSPFGLTGGPEGPAHCEAEAQGQSGGAAAPASAEAVPGRRRRRRGRRGGSIVDVEGRKIL